MITCKRCNVTQLEENFKPIKTVKSGRDGICKTCRRVDENIYREKNREKLKNYSREWNEKNREKRRISKNKWDKENPRAIDFEKMKIREINYRLKNRDARVKSSAKWAKANKNIVRHHLNMRRAKKLNATPEWVNLEKIKEVYLEAEIFTILTGVLYHVDHIVPLQSKIVCGLHCEFNLQALPASKNASKSNKFWPDMPD